MAIIFSVNCTKIPKGIRQLRYKCFANLSCSRWSFQFQSYVQLTRLQLLKKPSNCSVKIIERSIQNNRYCFLENARKEGSLCGAELEVLVSWYDWLNSTIGVPLDLIVYLKTSPEVAYERLKARGRKEEAGVPMEFIEVMNYLLLLVF